VYFYGNPEVKGIDLRFSRLAFLAGSSSVAASELKDSDVEVLLQVEAWKP